MELLVNVTTGEQTTRPLTAEEIADIEAARIPTTEQQEEARKQAYVAEADPLFFKWQRGEATEQEWLDKIAEIKARYPDPEVQQ